MKVTLVSQASVIIETSDCKIWTDPWLFGKAFMESWSLLPAANWSDKYYDEIDFLWVSHEHPDHFHLPTLKSMPKTFKERVTLLFQKNNSNKMPDAFRSLGFKNIQLLPHRKIVSITPETKIHCCQIGPTPDSSLAVMNKGYTLLNLNDCEANSQDCKIFYKDLGKVNLLLNQFSIAGYRGHFDYAILLKKNAQAILENMVQNHKDVRADITVPIASFVYFSDEDNRYVNAYMNTPGDVKAYFDKHNLKTAIMFPGDTFDSEKKFDSGPALVKFEVVYSNLDSLTYRTPEVIEVEKLRSVVEKRFQQLKEKYPRWIMNKLQPLIIKIPDIGKTIKICLSDGSFEEGNFSDFDMIMGSEAFHYAFGNKWGVSTIGVGAKYLIKSKQAVWRWYKIVGTLNNSEMYLKPKFLLSKNNMNFFVSRLEGGVNQLVYKWKRMKT
ncbi:MAG: MBL fold metallo-hydrolase [Chitinophagaceae bacterium]|nr:MBL fold metallo-hydrolase [Chitinophagaceae bacterium]